MGEDHGIAFALKRQNIFHEIDTESGHKINKDPVRGGVNGGRADSQSMVEDFQRQERQTGGERGAIVGLV